MEDPDRYEDFSVSFVTNVSLVPEVTRQFLEWLSMSTPHQPNVLGFESSPLADRKENDNHERGEDET
jgi:hypothetical protein